ncbi:hypothetical protein FQA47_018952 [Oryzias melastigma]|uniref:Uncharacterized protein n=1 Tax=Oryzias melastigma TaxID=30732 RepID=A0A834C454_ORYME|nr:hypothetical protein FQA47_018952 [Oryzias melastigma]
MGGTVPYKVPSRLLHLSSSAQHLLLPSSLVILTAAPSSSSSSRAPTSPGDALRWRTDLWFIISGVRSSPALLWTGWWEDGGDDGRVRSSSRRRRGRSPIRQRSRGRTEAVPPGRWAQRMEE